MNMRTSVSNSVNNSNTFLAAGVVTMSSREIAELTGKRHDNVKRLIDDLINSDVILEIPQFEEIPTATKPVLVYHLKKRETLIVVARLSPEFTAAVVDRWQELEAQVAAPVLPNFADPAQSARAWADQFEQRQKAEQALQLAAPKVEFVNRYVEGSGLRGVREVAKIIGAGQKEFVEWMMDKKIMYRLNGALTAHQNHIDAGRFETKTGVADNDHTYATTKFTAKGVEWVAGEWAKAMAREVLA